MNPDSQPIPLASVVVFPRWLSTFSRVVGAVGTVGVLAMVVAIALGWQEPPQGEQLAAMLITVGATLFALVLSWALARVRIRPQHLFRHIQQPALRAGAHRRGLVILVVLASVVVGVAGMGFGWRSRAFGMTVVDCVLLATIVGFVGAVRRHQRTQAVALFALYAEGALDPAATRTIDAARATDPVFDAAVHDYLRINSLVVAQLRSQS